jgi:RNA recognition motif-containing protein
MFQQFGEILTTKVVCDKDSKRSLGYGFVKFANEVDAARAMQSLNGYVIGHKMLKVSIARPPTQRNCKLYIANLPKEYSEQQVFSMLEQVFFFLIG